MSRARKKSGTAAGNGRASQRARLTALGRVEAAAGLASVFAHDLNQPLTAIMAYCEAGRLELKRPECSKEKVLRHLDQSLTQVRRMTEMIRDTRKSLARRRPEEAQTALDLGGAARDACEALEDMLLEQDIELAWVPAPGRVPVRAARLCVQYAAICLLQNAVEALRARPAGRRITVSVSRVDGMGQLKVEDNGPGIPAERMPHIFRAFHHTTTGLGMGLWTARSIAEAQGGKLWADNRSGGGADFRFQLPLIQ